MNLKKAFLLLAIISITSYTPINAAFTADEENKIRLQVNSILEWADSQTKQELEAKKDTVQFLNSRENDDEIIVEAKKRAKEQLFPEPEHRSIKETEESYWQRYAPQFAQNIASATSDYVASWIPESIKERVNALSTNKKIMIMGAILTSLSLVYNKDQLIEMTKKIIRDSSAPSATEIKSRKTALNKALVEWDMANKKKEALSEDHRKAREKYENAQTPEEKHEAAQMIGDTHNELYEAIKKQEEAQKKYYDAQAQYYDRSK